MAEENLGLDLASQTGQNNIKLAIDGLGTMLGDLNDSQEAIRSEIFNFSQILKNKAMGGGGGGSDSSGGDEMNLMDLYYIGYDSYTYKTSSLMDKYYASDELVNSFEIAGYLLEYGISQSEEIGKFFKRFTDIDATVAWDSLTSISDVAGNADAVTAILANNYAKNAISMSPSALAAFASLDSTNQIITDRVIYLCGLRLGLYGSYNEFVAKDVNKLLIADSSDAVNYFIGDSTRLAILFGNTDTVIQILKNPGTRPLLLESSNAIATMTTNTSVKNSIIGSRAILKELVKSLSVMTAFAEDSSFMSAIIADPVVLSEFANNFDIVGAIVMQSSTGSSAIINSTAAKDTLGSNVSAQMYILEKWCGIAIGDPDYSTLDDVLGVVCVNTNALVAFESASQNWNEFSKNILYAINQSTDHVVDIYNTLVANSDRFTAGARIDQDTVANADNSCKTKGVFYACKLSSWSGTTNTVTLFVNGDSMGTGCRVIAGGTYSMDDTVVNAIGFGESTFTEQGDGRLSVVPYTINS